MNLKKTALSLALLAIIAAPAAFAGGPIAQCAPGQAFVWGGGGTGIPFNPDMGDLVTAGDHDVAVDLVEAAFAVWEDVGTATATYVNAGELPEDVTGANVLTYWAEPAPDGLSPVIFDFDGSAGATLGFPGGVLGVAGIAWVNTITCEAFEGVALLIGPTFAGDPTAGFDVAVHEFGHYSGLGHTVVNGQIYLGSVGGDNSGPTPHDTFLPIPDPFTEVVETMYPFYYGPPIGTATLHKDDAVTLSELYPDPSFATDFVTVEGAAVLGTPVTGANVIARNVADPFFDAVSAISGDFSTGADAFTGQWDLEGLTPGADYAIYVDEILAGGFSTPVLSPLPGPEEFWNGASESTDPSVDDPSVYEAVSGAAGDVISGIDILFNQPGEGDPLPVGDDGSVQLALPFTFCLTGRDWNSVYVNANGSLTFGAGDTDFSESAQEFLDGPPRIAGLWDDLNPSAGGTVSFSSTADTFTVSWDDVPEWLATGSNNFDITLIDRGGDCDGEGAGGPDVVIDYGDISIVDGLVGVGHGLYATSGVEDEVDISSFFGTKVINMKRFAARYELFDVDQDMAGRQSRYIVRQSYSDKFENNDSLSDASTPSLPLATLETKSQFSSIFPAAADIDFYSFEAEAGQTLLAQTTRGQLDTVLGLWFCPGGVCNNATAIFIGLNDDVGVGSNPLLSGFLFPIPLTGTYAVAVTFCCDYDFDGVDPGQGEPFDSGRYVLELDLIDGTLVTLGDDNSVNVPMSFSFPYQGGSYTDVYINSNGNLTFGAGDSDFSESTAELLSGDPRIAPLWDDLSPNAGGLVYFKDEGTSFSVTFEGVPEFISTGANSFVVTLGDDGSVDISYGDVSATDGLAGLSEGGGAADPGGTDLSGAGVLPVLGTTYELFDFGNAFDLSGVNLDFDP